MRKEKWAWTEVPAFMERSILIVLCFVGVTSDKRGCQSPQITERTSPPPCLLRHDCEFITPDLVTSSSAHPHAHDISNEFSESLHTPMRQKCALPHSTIGHGFVLTSRF